MTDDVQTGVGWRHARLHEYYKEHQDLLSGILARCNWEKIGYRAPRSTHASPAEIILDEQEHLLHIEAVQRENAAAASQQSLSQPAMTQEQWLAFQLQQNAAQESKELERQEKNRVRNRKKRDKQRAKQLAYQKASHRPAKKQFTENRIARELDIQQHESVDVNYGLPDLTPNDPQASEEHTRQMVSYGDD